MEKLPHYHQSVRNLMAGNTVEGEGRTPLTQDFVADAEMRARIKAKSPR